MIIFLDIDGVLCSFGMIRTGRAGAGKTLFDEKCVTHFNHLASMLYEDGIRPQICISSAWRMHRSVSELQHIFRENGIDIWRSVTGTTGSRNDGRRDREILDWLSDDDYNHYLVIDDEMISDMCESEIPHDNLYCVPNSETGLTEGDVHLIHEKIRKLKERMSDYNEIR